MRVKGNISPVTLSVETYQPLEGYVDVRLRENIKEVTGTDPWTGNPVTMFEYDEYTFVMPSREGLREDIESNLNDWLVTGRTLEVNENASIVQDMKTENAEYETALSEIETALGVNA